MGKKGGGAPDTSGLEEATKQATALQKKIYEETREDVQPWYNMGVGSVSKLSDLLGVTGGSVQSRDQIYQGLLPQYTTQETLGGGGNLYRSMDGRVFDIDDMGSMRQSGQLMAGLNAWDTFSDEDKRMLAEESFGWSPMQQTQTRDVTDYEALNAAVEERLAGQSETPEGFGSLLERFDLDKFEEDPSYQFRQEEANKALERQMAAQGVTLGGGGLGSYNPQASRAIQELNQNLASQEYGNAYNRYVQDQLNTYNMLMGTAGMGQGSTGIMATGGQNYATNVGNLQTGLASAQLNAQQAANAQSGSMFGSLLGAGAQLGAAYLTGGGSLAGGAGASTLLSDKSQKENIEFTHVDNGHRMYNFTYIGDDTLYNGVMAQDILETDPEAVIEIDGVLHVDYSQLGVEMKEVV